MDVCARRDQRVADLRESESERERERDRDGDRGRESESGCSPPL